MRSIVPRAACLFLVSLLPLLSACGGGNQGPTADELISGLVADVSDAAFDQQRFESLFTAGMAPDANQRSRYPAYMYRTKSVEVQGDSATATVEVEHGTSGNILGEFPWTFRREGDAWKLSAAPLPPE